MHSDLRKVRVDRGICVWLSFLGEQKKSLITGEVPRMGSLVAFGCMIHTYDENRYLSLPRSWEGAAVLVLCLPVDTLKFSGLVLEPIITYLKWVHADRKADI